MPPRAVPLAYAGRKLTGPPEGYNSKKELQVKKWLTSTAQSDTVSDALPSVASQSEVSVRWPRSGLPPALGPATSVPFSLQLSICSITVLRARLTAFCAGGRSLGASSGRPVHRPARQHGWDAQASCRHAASRYAPRSVMHQEQGRTQDACTQQRRLAASWSCFALQVRPYPSRPSSSHALSATSLLPLTRAHPAWQQVRMSSAQQQATSAAPLIHQPAPSSPYQQQAAPHAPHTQTQAAQQTRSHAPRSPQPAAR